VAGAGALSIADRHHFDLNLSDLLDKSTQRKRKRLLNAIAARQRFERQQANFEGIQTLSIANSKLIKCLDDYMTSFLVVSLNLVLPTAPSLGHSSVPNLPGPKDAGSSAEDLICNHSERSRPSLVSPTATMCTRPHNACTNLQTSLSKLLQQRQINPSELQHDGVPHDGLLPCGTCCTLLCSHSSHN